jgi:microcystin-dependent protein
MRQRSGGSKTVQAEQIIRETLSENLITIKGAGRVVQAVEHLPSKLHTLSSNSSTATTKQNRTKQQKIKIKITPPTYHNKKLYI